MFTGGAAPAPPAGGGYRAPNPLYTAGGRTITPQNLAIVRARLAATNPLTARPVSAAPSTAGPSPTTVTKAPPKSSKAATVKIQDKGPPHGQTPPNVSGKKNRRELTMLELAQRDEAKKRRLTVEEWQYLKEKDKHNVRTPDLEWVLKTRKKYPKGLTGTTPWGGAY
jgi:hypothetical protein